MILMLALLFLSIRSFFNFIGATTEIVDMTLFLLQGDTKTTDKTLFVKQKQI